MKVLVACEYSDTVSAAFRARGHDVTSCDLEPSEGDGQHVQGDVLPLLREEWDLVIAHPPCNYLTQLNDTFPKKMASAKWQARFEEAVEFFHRCLNANAPAVAVENPRMHWAARQRIRRYDIVVQPYHYGDGYSKATGFWLRGLPPLMAALVNPAHQPLVGSGMGTPGWRSRSPNRAKENTHERSRFSRGMAKAMAEQWG